MTNGGSKIVNIPDDIKGQDLEDTIHALASPNKVRYFEKA